MITKEVLVKYRQKNQRKGEIMSFIYNIPTKVYFGDGYFDCLEKELKAFGKNVLLVYGGGSIKKIGLYEKILKQTNDCSLKVFELSGIEPNPKVDSVRKGIKLCKENEIDVILAVGGGSVIDAAKFISVGACYDFDIWDFVTNKISVEKALPVVTLLTISATGSEMDPTAVLNNPQTNDKIGVTNEIFYPKVSFCDPSLTFSVGKYQTACGSADILSHIMEVYFNQNQNLYMLDKSMEGMMKTVIKFAPVALSEPENYEARANLMWTSSWAINGYISGCNKAPWSCHPMEHQLSAVYDITHGLGLAILTPRWMNYVLDETTVEKFYNFGVNVFELEKSSDKMSVAKQAIKCLEKFFYETLGLKSHLSELGIDDSKFEFMAQKATGGKFINGWKKLSAKDVEKIYKMSL